MGKVKEIAEGIENILFRKKEVEKVAKARMKICNSCEYISTKHKTNKLFVHCTKCMCPLSTKTRSMDTECPLSPPKWTSVKIKSYESKETHN